MNPGPSTALVLSQGINKMGKKENSVTRYSAPGSNRVFTLVSGGKGKKKKNNQGRMALSVSARRSGGMMNAASFDMELYRCVLSDPFSCLPVRLGGEMMQPSGTATLSWRGIINTSAAGNFSAVIYPTGQSPMQVSVSAASPYTYNAQAGPYPGSAALVGISPGGRVIAAGIRVVTTASATSNQGVITIGCLPRSSVNFTGSASLTEDGFPVSATLAATQGFNEFFNYLQTESYPLKLGASAFYRSEDPLDYTFRQLIIVGPGSAELSEDLCPFFVVGVTGAAATTPLLFELIVHIEYTVTSGTTGVVNTGVGRIPIQGLVDTGKTVFSRFVDSTIQGVSGGLGLKDALISAGTAGAARGVKSLIGSALNSAGNYFSNTNNTGLGY